MTEKRNLGRTAARGLLSAGGWLAVCASLAGSLGGLAWWLDLASHFRPQWAGLLAAAALGAILLGLRRQGLVFGAVALVNLAAVAPLYLVPGRDALPPGADLSVLTVNIDHDRTEFQSVVEMILALDPDVALIQEVTPEGHFPLQEVAVARPHSLEAPRADCAGILLYSRFPLSDPRMISGEYGKTILAANLAVGDRTLRVVGVHPMPPKSKTLSEARDRLLVEAAEQVREAQGPVLFFGDFNLTRFSSRARALKARTGLVNTEDGFGFYPTWPAGPLRWVLGVMIDQVWVSPDIVVLDREILPVPGSDHHLILTRLRITQTP